MKIKKPTYTCSVCGRLVQANALGARNVDMHPVLEFHLNPKTGKECRDSDGRHPIVPTEATP